MIEKFLIINADDFGFSADINAAIEQLHRAGIVTNTTLMVDGAQADDALKIAQRNPGLGVGLHLDLCPVAGFYGLPYPQMREELHKPAVLARIAEEVARQIKVFKRLGLEFQHMDGHRHFHALPELFTSVVDVAASHGLKTIRFTKDWILPRTPSVYLEDEFYRDSIDILRRHNIACAGKFIYGWKDYSVADIEGGWNELMVHVGFDDEHYLREFRQLSLPTFAQALTEAGVQMRSFVEMARQYTGHGAG